MHRVIYQGEQQNTPRCERLGGQSKRFNEEKQRIQGENSRIGVKTD